MPLRPRWSSLEEQQDGQWEVVWKSIGTGLVEDGAGVRADVLWPHVNRKVGVRIVAELFDEEGPLFPSSELDSQEERGGVLVPNNFTNAAHPNFRFGNKQLVEPEMRVIARLTSSPVTICADDPW
mmetsp:Transcript_15937/g.37274  ORF Transcript_15937/g.37274 Transcript_15937/m.37274 type:complete len:125 (+) Transcript_15937:473-847(+)